MTPVRVVVAEDQATVREGLVALLGLVPGIQVVAEAEDGWPPSPFRPRSPPRCG